MSSADFQMLVATYGVKPTLGAVLLGSLIALFFSGIVMMQVFLYYRIYLKDRLRFKVIVFCVWILDLMHTGMICGSNWNYLIGNFGNADIADTIPWTVAATIALTAFLTFFVHCFFCHRIHTLSKTSWWITAPIVLHNFLYSPSSQWSPVTTSQMIRLGSYTEFTGKFSWVFTMGLALAAVVDVLIAAGLCWYLNKSRTGFSTMDGIIDSITLYTVENGMLTCVTTVVSLICWLSMPRNLIFLALHFAISKLYANAFLATLNARKVLRGKSQGSSDRSDHPMPVLFPENYSRYSRNPYNSRREVDPISTKVSVQINVEKIIERDAESGEPSDHHISYPPSTPSQQDIADIDIKPIQHISR
ncbi:hypothetical protein NLI96_g7405 [Meripilus lineatus]|uniref:DUF6534 domain-containing protein n=1 Tax=Meripilus lineatus TaxID=2056292 RepID=A0AAD5V0Y7_9APHY|nr:hypothetical protein NLI96_g7405 [Physisporinus lineatus]